LIVNLDVCVSDP